MPAIRITSEDFLARSPLLNIGRMTDLSVSAGGTTVGLVYNGEPRVDTRGNSR